MQLSHMHVADSRIHVSSSAEQTTWNGGNEPRVPECRTQPTEPTALISHDRSQTHQQNSCCSTLLTTTTVNFFKVSACALFVVLCFGHFGERHACRAIRGAGLHLRSLDVGSGLISSPTAQPITSRWLPKSAKNASLLQTVSSAPNSMNSSPASSQRRVTLAVTFV